MENYKLSVVCTIFNAEKFLSTAIESVLSQDYQEWELLLVDDGSTDSSLEICEKYRKQDKRIHVYSNKNSGPYNERIFGYKNAKGNYILSLDSDDRYEPNAFTKIINLISERNCDLLFYNCYLVEDNRCTILDNTRYKVKYTSNHQKILSVYFENFVLNQGLYRKCFSRELLKNIDLSSRSERIFEDGLFSLKLFMVAKNLLVCNDCCFYSYRKINNESLTKIYSGTDIAGFNNLLEHFVIVNSDATLTNSFIKKVNTILTLSILTYYKWHCSQILDVRKKSTFKINFINNVSIKKIFGYKINILRLRKLIFLYFELKKEFYG